MALRKYQAATNKDEQVITTGDGHTLVRGSGNVGCEYCFLPPPSDGNYYVLLGEYWFGPFYLSATGQLLLNTNGQTVYPAYEGADMGGA